MARIKDAAKRSAPPAKASSSPTGFGSLLVPIDLEAISDRVLGRLSLLPLAADARLTILHVVPGNLAARERRNAERDARNALTNEARHLRRSLPKNVSVEPLVTVGTVAREISAQATEAKAELIVMGRGGGRAIRDTFLGSTAERVVRQAHIPVLVVRLRPRIAYARPVVSLALDHTADEIVRFMLRVLPAPRPPVLAVHAFDIPYEGLIYPSLSGDHAAETREELQFQARQRLDAMLGTAMANSNVPPEDGPLWSIQVRYGSPRMVVEKAMKKSDADLLVLGTRGYSGAKYVFMGTVAGGLLRAASCDVLVVPPAPSGE